MLSTVGVYIRSHKGISAPYLPLNSEGIACCAAELNAALCRVTRENENIKYLSTSNGNRSYNLWHLQSRAWAFTTTRGFLEISMKWGKTRINCLRSTETNLLLTALKYLS